MTLARKVSQAWVSFARTGDPNHAGLPKRDAVKNDPEAEARRLMTAAG